MFCYRCPECAEVLFAPADEVGRETLCPKCWKPIRIPEPGGAESEELWDPYEPISVVPLGEEFPSDDGVSPSARLYRPDLDNMDPVDEEPPTPLDHRPFEEPRPTRSDPRSNDPAPPKPTAAPRDDSSPTPRAVRRSGIMTSKAELESTARLVAALRVRMAPPPIPQSDVRFSTAVWLILTISALVLWGVAVSTNPMGFRPTLGLGVLVSAFGFFIVVAKFVQTPRRMSHWTRLLPRAGWYTSTGGMIIALALLGPAVRSKLIPVVAEERTSFTESGDSHRGGPMAMLRAAKDQRESDALLEVLHRIAEPDGIPPDADRGELGVELLILTNDSRLAVRNAALRAAVVLDTEGAEAALLKALRSSDPIDRETAITLASHRPSSEVITELTALFETGIARDSAREALIRIGGPTVESAVLPLLNSDRPLLVLETLAILEEIGGPISQSALETLSRGPDLLIRQAAGESAQRIAERLAKDTPRKSSNE